MIRILGIDPGLANTGWGIIEADSNRLFHIAHGTIVTDKGTEPAQRVFQIYTAVREVICSYSPRLAGIETLYFAKNRRSAIPVAEARGALLVALAQECIDCVSHTPLEIKQALTGSGRAEKRQVQEMVRMMLGLEQVPQPDHAADALAAAICAYHMKQFSSKMPGVESRFGGEE